MDYAECLHRFGELPAANVEVDAARAMFQWVGGAVRKRLLPRLTRLHALTLHEDGRAEAASQVYGKFLDNAALNAGKLDDPDLTLETFGVLQDMVLTMSSLGRMDEAL